MKKADGSCSIPTTTSMVKMAAHEERKLHEYSSIDEDQASVSSSRRHSMI
jgi:hypothetical protein